MHALYFYLESGGVELVWILEELRAVMQVPEQRHHLPPLGNQEPCRQTDEINTNVRSSDGHDTQVIISNAYRASIYILYRLKRRS